MYTHLQFIEHVEDLLAIELIVEVVESCELHHIVIVSIVAV